MKITTYKLIVGRQIILILLLCILISTIAKAQMFGGRTIPYRYRLIPSTITLAQNQEYYVASVYDENYLPYTAPTGAATTATSVNPNGTSEAIIINIQGSITTTGISLTLPVTATGSGTLPAYSTTVNISAELTEDGISSDITLSWAEQAYTTFTKSITVNIKADGVTLNAKKLDINAGIGNDYIGVLLGSFNYPYNNAGAITAYQVRIRPGILDKMFGVADLSGNYTHNMLYLPVVGEDGKIWLNNNLGAHYADLNSAHFSIMQQAIAYNDWKAYGSHFQWGRKPDGHELITWTTATEGNYKYGTTNTNIDIPTNTLFILEPNSPYDWRSTTNGSLWFWEASANNPCPKGFMVPSLAQINNLTVFAGISNYTNAASSNLKFSAGGDRNYSAGTVGNAGSKGSYWSNDVFSSEGGGRCFTSDMEFTVTTYKASGFSVRCIKD